MLKKYSKYCGEMEEKVWKDTRKTIKREHVVGTVDQQQNHKWHWFKMVMNGLEWTLENSSSAPWFYNWNKVNEEWHANSNCELVVKAETRIQISQTQPMPLLSDNMVPLQLATPMSAAKWDSTVYTTTEWFKFWQNKRNLQKMIALLLPPSFIFHQN